VLNMPPFHGSLEGKLQACLPVLTSIACTEPHWFCGSFELVSFFAYGARVPVLAKDFFSTPAQVREASARGASAVLLILDMLGWRGLEELYEEARRQGLEPLVETKSAEDAVEVMSSFPHSLVGINARNLETLQVSFTSLLREVEKASREKPRGALIVAESSVDSLDKAMSLAKAGADALLIGTWAMKNVKEVRIIREFFIVKILIFKINIIIFSRIINYIQVFQGY